MPKIKAVNHVAVVVDDMEKSLLFWRDALGIELHELRDVPAEKSQVAFMPVAGAEVELVMPTTDDSGILPSADQACITSVWKWMTLKV
jgi:methylmalonyl-CoA/ethylmalonyl-CoA epimerase